MSEEGEALIVEPRGRQLISHSLVVAISLGVGQLLAYLVSVIAARRLGPTEFGIFAALLAIVLIGSVLAMGIQVVAARRVVQLDNADRGGSAHQILRSALIGGIAVAGATLIISPLLMWLLKIDIWWPLLLVALSFIPLTWAGGMLGIAQGRESYLRLSGVYLSMGIGRGLGGVVGALAFGSVTGTMAGLTIGSLIGVVIGRWVVAPLAQGHIQRVASLWPQTFHATHALLALFVLTNVDVLLARALLTPTQAGDYGVGAVIAKVAFWLPQFIGVVAFPRFADGRRARATIVTLSAVAGMGLLVVVATAALPSLVVGLVGGSAYATVVPYAWMFAAIGASFALAQALLLTRLAVDDRRAVFAIWVAAAVLVTLATWVMPRSVPGLAASALSAGALLVIVGIVVTLAELRSPDYSTTIANGSGQPSGV